MKSLDEEYASDPVLLRIYKKNLLIPGWAGEVDDIEAAYIARHLNKSPLLRRTWKTKEIIRFHRKITITAAYKLAKWWAENMP
jgi:hypothetical protein